MAQRDECVGVEHFEQSIGLVLDRLADLEARQMTDQQMTAAFAAGAREALRDQKLIDDVIDSVSDTVQRRAAEQTGRAVGGTIKTLFSKWLLIGFILLLVAKLAGLDVAHRVWLAIKGVA